MEREREREREIERERERDREREDWNSGCIRYVLNTSVVVKLINKICVNLSGDTRAS